jgi:RNA recognition motif-containing protein
VYVSGLSWAVTSEQLLQHFQQQMGFVAQKAVVLQKVRNGKTFSLGCGVIDFASTEDAATAVDLLNGTEMDGRVIKVREDRALADAGAGGIAGASPSTKRAGEKPGKVSAAAAAAAVGAPRILEPTKVFVTSLAWETTSETLMTEFAACGLVVSAEVLSTRKGRSLGHAVIEFAAPQSASLAIAEFSGKEIDGRSIVVREYYQN